MSFCAFISRRSMDSRRVEWPQHSGGVSVLHGEIPLRPLSPAAHTKTDRKVTRGNDRCCDRASFAPCVAGGHKWSSIHRAEGWLVGLYGFVLAAFIWRRGAAVSCRVSSSCLQRKSHGLQETRTVTQFQLERLLISQDLE